MSRIVHVFLVYALARASREWCPDREALTPWQMARAALWRPRSYRLQMIALLVQGLVIDAMRQADRIVRSGDEWPNLAELN